MVDQFLVASREAVSDKDLAAHLLTATTRQYTARQAIMQELEDLERLRELACSLRDRVLLNLDELLGRLVNNLTARGVKVHFAADAAAARRIVLEVCRSRSVKTIVKSKSMLSEEIHLSPELEQDGIEVTETDLGEFIVQLTGEGPSHIVTPAVHLDTQQVADVFRERIGFDGPAEPEALTKAARKHLRERFRRADMGISGVNFGVADPGLICVCTNEGNGRYVTGWPKTYLALMGMERLVANVSQLAVVLKLLARSSTGQRITQYTNLIFGPAGQRQSGPEEMHLVIVDNGRSSILSGKHWRTLRCIRCGACLNACPVFRKLGGQVYGGCYSGPIGKILLPLLEGTEAHKHLPRISSLCGLCNQVCPVKVPIVETLLELREQLNDEGRRTFGEKAAMSMWSLGLTAPRMFRFAQKAMRVALKPLSRSGWVGTLVIPPPANWTKVRDLPLPAKRSFVCEWIKSQKKQRPEANS